MTTSTVLRVLGTPLAAVGMTLSVWAAAPANAATPIGLGTAASFAVLAGSTVTNTGPTTIHGDVGVSPGTAMPGFGTATITGTQHSADGVADQAKSDLTTAYDTAAGQSTTATVSSDLGGQRLAPGVYTGPTLGLTGTVTLDAANDPNAIFVFQAASTLITASTSVVALVRGANPCNVFWQVGSSATLGTNSVFAGSVLALTSITATTGAKVTGRLLARNGATTLDSNTIMAPSCVSVTVTPGSSTSPTAGPAVTPSSPAATTPTVTASTPGTTTPTTSASTPGTTPTVTASTPGTTTPTTTASTPGTTTPTTTASTPGTTTTAADGTPTTTAALTPSETSGAALNANGLPVPVAVADSTTSVGAIAPQAGDLNAPRAVGTQPRSIVNPKARTGAKPGGPFGLVPPSLPRTGAPLAVLVAIGLVVVGSGVVLLLSAKRRREA